MKNNQDFIKGIYEKYDKYTKETKEKEFNKSKSSLKILGMVASFYFLSLALRNLPLGTAYAIWTGIGTIGTVILGILLFKEPISFMRIACIALIVCGITGLKLITH